MNKKYVLGVLVFFGCIAQGVIDKSAKIYVAGHTGLVGSALMRRLQADGYNTLITRTSEQLDLRNQQQVDLFFAQEKPEYVFLAAAKVGGIQANMNYPVDFLYDNLLMSANIIHAAYKNGVTKLLFLGSSCIYPRICTQPITEDSLLTGELEKTNEPYAVAKIAGIKLCQAYNKQYGTRFISCMPTNLYGPGDNFDENNSHVLPALLAKIYKAKQAHANQVEIWGTGTPYREFLYVDDLADALLFLMNYYESSDIVNVGTGNDVTIAQLATLIKEIVGYEGNLIFNAAKPDGTPRKQLDVSRLKDLGWTADISLQEGIKKTLVWYEKNKINKIV